MKGELCVGQIVKAQGIAGEVKLSPLTDDPSRFASLKECFVDTRSGRLEVKAEKVRVSPGAVYIKLSGVNDRNAAEALRGCDVYVSRENTVPLEEGRYFIEDLKGCKVQSSDGAELGVLTDVLQYGAADVYVIDGERQLMVPALKRLLQKVDTAAGLIVLDSAVLEEVAVYQDED